ncbi:MAG: hypothetical protein M3342_24530 [Bacteroidota bacterium]|nr:hypothetical protein [Bacteroidota bacterium]
MGNCGFSEKRAGIADVICVVRHRNLNSKKVLEASVEFKDLMGSMLNIQTSTSYDEDEDDYR